VVETKKNDEGSARALAAQSRMTMVLEWALKCWMRGARRAEMGEDGRRRRRRLNKGGGVR
jgi:hypothetical protein